MGIEVPNQEGGDLISQLQHVESFHRARVVNIIIEVDNPPTLPPYTDVSY